MTDKIVLLSTCDSEASARSIARRLLEQRLAACVTIIPGAMSLYWWEDKIEESGEWLLLVKSRHDLFERLQAEIGAVHTYQVPEVIAVGIAAGSEPYLDWMDRQLGLL